MAGYWMAGTSGHSPFEWAVGIGNVEIALFQHREDAILFRASPDMLKAIEDIILLLSGEARFITDRADLINIVRKARGER